MAVASPITRQTVGRTFVVAISLLSATAVVQLGTLSWAFYRRMHTPGTTAALPAVAEQQPPLARLTTPDFNADPIDENEAASATPALPSRPTPVPQPQLRASESSPPEGRFVELLEQGKVLRERGDMSTALVRFREAQRMDQKSPQAIFEIATTYERMALPDRAAEQWRRIYEMGESAGVYYTAAEAKLKASQAQAILQAAPQNAAPAGESGAATTGATLALLPITMQAQTDTRSASKFTLRVPLQARAGTKIDVRDLIIQVHFYDLVDEKNVVTTAANTSTRWSTAPPDWNDADTEVLEVDYQLPAADRNVARRENRKYYGYIVRVYYKDELQAASALPERLAAQYPAPRILSKEPEK